ncbi:MAG TPA: hypothetical protein VME86_06355 [Acidobacteriaceae bacterium]|nr:hypothetical protein [Acidobacteriaceae bacterium]
MNALQPIPADLLLDKAILALTFADAAELNRLERIAPAVIAPVDEARCLNQRAVFAALLDASARNLRLLRRALGRRGAESVRLADR